ncbi:MAG: PQQ-binding-like beta-propeller repeat protein [Cyanobacteria bacterium J06634_5]
MGIQAKWKFGIKGAREVSQRCPVLYQAVDQTADISPENSSKSLVLATFNFKEKGALRGVLAALDIDSGEAVWQFEVSHSLTTPWVVQEAIYVTCFDGSVYRLNGKGEVQWRSRPGHTNLWQGVWAQNLIVYAEIAGRAQYTRALNSENGEVVWTYKNGGHSYALTADVSSCGQGRIVHCSVSSPSLREPKMAVLHCLEVASGQLLWRTAHRQYLFAPLIDGPHVYIGSRGHVALFCLETGRLLNEFPLAQLANTPLAKQGTQRAAVNQTNQETDWEKIAVRARPIKTSQGIVFTLERGGLFCLALKASNDEAPTLETKWHCHIEADIEAEIVPEKDNLLVISELGELMVVATASGEIGLRQKISGFTRGYGLAVISESPTERLRPSPTDVPRCRVAPSARIIMAASRNCTEINLPL